MDFGKVGSPFMQVYTGSETTAKVTNLEAGCKYSFRVRSSNGACLSEYSKVCEFEATEPEEPAPEEEAAAEEVGEVTEDDWYEAWLEDERLRKDDERKMRIHEANSLQRKKEAARDYHEKLKDKHFRAAVSLQETKEHFSSLHAEISGILAKRDSNKSGEQGHRPASEVPRQLHKVVQDVSDRLRELEAEEDNREAT